MFQKIRKITSHQPFLMLQSKAIKHQSYTTCKQKNTKLSSYVKICTIYLQAYIYLTLDIFMRVRIISCSPFYLSQGLLSAMADTQ